MDRCAIPVDIVCKVRQQRIRARIEKKNYVNAKHLCIHFFLMLALILFRKEQTIKTAEYKHYMNT